MSKFKAGDTVFLSDPTWHKSRVFGRLATLSEHYPYAYGQSRYPFRISGINKEGKHFNIAVYAREITLVSYE